MDYKRYRWFFTKSGKLVYGGKSAEQNEEVINELLKSEIKRIVMHTKIPGSPFAVIDSSVEKLNESDLEEVAIWTACFSRAWKSGLKKTQVDIFSNDQIFKKKGMKIGTFGVSNETKRKNVELKLYSIVQKKVLRFVPFKTKGICIIPGKIPKDKFTEQISKKLNIKKEEILNALPTGGFKLCN